MKVENCLFRLKNKTHKPMYFIPMLKKFFRKLEGKQ